MPPKNFTGVKSLRRILSAVLVASLTVAGCASDGVEQVKPPVVKVQRVGMTDGVSAENYSGVVRGRYESNLAFRVGGKIISRDVQTGSRVRSGDVLMTLDAKDIAEQSRSAQANVESARAQLQLAQSNLDRYTELFKSEAIAAVVLDQYRTQYDAARAAYDAAVAAANQSQNALDYTALTADADGVISNVAAEVGQVVAAGQTVLTLVQTAELEVVVNIPENKITDMQIGRRVSITFWATGNTVTGTVREISPMADAASRTFAVKISLPPVPDVQLGMTAGVSVNESTPRAIVLPLSAIYQTGDAAQVWLVENGKVSLRKVEVTAFDGNSVRVHGLTAGDVIVVAGVHKLRDGQEVRTGD